MVPFPTMVLTFQEQGGGASKPSTAHAAGTLQGSAAAGAPPGQKEPAGQGALAFAGEALPAAQPKPAGAAHGPEQLAVVRLGEAPKKPAAQGRGAHAPSGQNTPPAGQPKHASKDAPPGLPAKVPAGQRVHAAAPGVALNVPGAQGAQRAMLPPRHVPGGQGAQLVLLFKNVPGAQAKGSRARTLPAAESPTYSLPKTGSTATP
jgi:hypothetical protein